MTNSKLLEQVRNYFRYKVKRLVTSIGYYNHYSYRIFNSKTLESCGIDTVTEFNQVENIESLRSYDGIADYRACFGKFLVDLNGIYGRPRSIFLWKPFLIPTFPTQGNFTWMTRDQLINHLNYCKDYLGLDYEVNIEDELGYEQNTAGFTDFYKICFDFKKLSYLQIKFVLFWSRYACEFWSNLALLDAMLLKEAVFPEEELYNLLVMSSLVLMMTTYKMSCPGYISEGQCLSIYGKFISKKNLITILNNFSTGQITELVFNRINYDAWVNSAPDIKFPKINVKVNNTTYDIDILGKWLNDESINKRLEVYKKLYPWYKSEEQN